MPKNLTSPDYLNHVKEAKALRDSPRGQYLITRGLLALEVQLTKVQGHMREMSDIADIRFILDMLYPGMTDALKALHKLDNTRIVQEANHDNPMTEGN